MEADGKNPLFSDEHILSEDLTGKLQNNPFVIPDVHHYCNNMAGMFMDAAVTRFWLINAEKAMRAADYISIKGHPALPPVYMGLNTQLTYQGKVCENWVGPAASSIYHFHDPYPTDGDEPPMVGVPPSKKKKVDKGFAFLVFRSNNPAWHPTVLRSYAKYFKGTTLYLANMDTPFPLFPEVPDELKELNKLVLAPGADSVKNAIDVTADHRFLAKMAIGVGWKFLGERFLNNPAYEQLRNFMWGKNKAVRKAFSFRGKGMFDMDDDRRELARRLGWDGCHTLTIVNAKDDIVIFLVVYQKFVSHVKIAKNGEDYTDQLGSGITFVISPGLKRAVGPMSYDAYNQYKVLGYGIPELEQFEKDLKNTAQNPPLNI